MQKKESKIVHTYMSRILSLFIISLKSMINLVRSKCREEIKSKPELGVRFQKVDTTAT